MPLQLTTPIDGGFIADGETYTHAKIAFWDHNSEDDIIRLELRFGNMVDDELVLSPFKELRKNVVIRGEDYETLVNESMSMDGENLYNGMKRVLYGWIVSQGILDGEVV